jgi:GT2 family glycosyltransferase
VRNLFEQTVLPRELCIVDSSDDTPTRTEIERLCGDAGVALDYVHPAPRGLTVQRNIGIDRTTGDPLCFIDDDIWMRPDAHEEVLAEFARWGPEIGGVRGMPVEPPQPGTLTVLWRRFFLMGGWWPKGSGRVRASFFGEGVSSTDVVYRVEFFTGLFMAFRRQVFEYERFDEKLVGYGFKEDVDFSYRVFKRGYLLVQTPNARIQHLQSSTERMRAFELQRMHVANIFYLHQKNMPRTLKYRAALWWALLGTLLLDTGRALRARDAGYVAGLAAGLLDNVRGRGPSRE